MENIESEGLEYQIVEQLLDDRNADVLDLVLLNGPIEAMRPNLNLLRDEGTNLHNIYQYFFHLFATEKTLGFQEFVDWCVKNYSLLERVIMTLDYSTILCLVNSSFIRQTLYVPEELTLKAKDYSDDSTLRCFKESTIQRKK